MVSVPHWWHLGLSEVLEQELEAAPDNVKRPLWHVNISCTMLVSASRIVDLA